MAKRHIYLEDVPLDQARATLQTALAAVGRAAPTVGEVIALENALGRITAEPVRAKLSSPHFHCAAMDGYAVRAADTVDARETRAVSLRLGQNANAVNTGDPLPEGANAVIMIENVNQAEDGRLPNLCGGGALAARASIGRGHGFDRNCANRSIIRCVRSIWAPWRAADILRLRCGGRRASPLFLPAANWSRRSNNRSAGS